MEFPETHTNKNVILKEVLTIKLKKKKKKKARSQPVSTSEHGIS